MHRSSTFPKNGRDACAPCIAARGPPVDRIITDRCALEELRLRLYERIGAIGIGAQGLGGLITGLDVKIRSFPTHAASLPVARDGGAIHCVGPVPADDSAGRAIHASGRLMWRRA